jgi:pyruvate,orthophosphate dikinase
MRVFTQGRAANTSLTAAGRLALDADTAIRMSQDGPVILCRAMTEPSDIHGMEVSVGILTARGGALSHAAVVAREMGKAAVVGAGFDVDLDSRTITKDGVTLREGAEVTLESDGVVRY